MSALDGGPARAGCALDGGPAPVDRALEDGPDVRVPRQVPDRVGAGE